MGGRKTRMRNTPRRKMLGRTRRSKRRVGGELSENFFGDNDTKSTSSDKKPIRFVHPPKPGETMRSISTRQNIMDYYLDPKERASAGKRALYGTRRWMNRARTSLKSAYKTLRKRLMKKSTREALEAQEKALETRDHASARKRHIKQLMMNKALGFSPAMTTVYMKN